MPEWQFQVYVIHGPNLITKDFLIPAWNESVRSFKTAQFQTPNFKVVNIEGIMPGVWIGILESLGAEVFFGMSFIDEGIHRIFPAYGRSPIGSRGQWPSLASRNDELDKHLSYSIQPEFKLYNWARREPNLRCVTREITILASMQATVVVSCQGTALMTSLIRWQVIACQFPITVRGQTHVLHRMPFQVYTEPPTATLGNLP